MTRVFVLIYLIGKEALQGAGQTQKVSRFLMSGMWKLSLPWLN